MRAEIGCPGYTGPVHPHDMPGCIIGLGQRAAVYRCATVEPDHVVPGSILAGNLHIASLFAIASKHDNVLIP